jgi:serine/threonine-protein kinase
MGRSLLSNENFADRYRVVARIARGSSGEIFSVVDEWDGRQLALKRLLECGDRNQVLLFEREFHLLSSLRHPRIIDVYDYGVAGAPYYTMELLEGSDLRSLAPVEVTQAATHLRDIAVSLAWLHSRRVLHRDVSPRNARLDRHGRCKLLDFGALTTFGTAEVVVGTPPCVPPEALHAEPLDQRADLYGLGAVGYRLLTGRYAC